jgi:hypothetical protein
MCNKIYRNKQKDKGSMPYIHKKKEWETQKQR